MGLRKKKVKYDYVVKSSFVSGIVHIVQKYLDEASEQDEVVQQVCFVPKFSLQRKCRIFEIVSEARNIEEFDMNVELIKQLDDDGVLFQLAMQLYEDAVNNMIEVAAAFVSSCPKSKKPGVIFFWQKG